jgi:elongation factor 1-alpha
MTKIPKNPYKNTDHHIENSLSKTTKSANDSKGPKVPFANKKAPNKSYIGHEFPPSIRIGLLGGVDVGKSSLLGVIKNNKLDDGRGSSRKNIMYHKHELQSGRTSSVTSHYVYLENNLITFIDLAGHETYLKTTIYGLYGLNLDYVCIIIGANMGINKMIKEHFYLSKVLELPIIFIINKIDICPENIINQTFNDLNKLVKSISQNTKKLNIIENLNMIHNLDIHKVLFINNKIKPYYIYLNNKNINIINNYKDICKNKKSYLLDNYDFYKFYPILFTSNKNGYGIDNLKDFFLSLTKTNYIIYKNNLQLNNDKNNINTFIIENTYNVVGIGLVFFGYVKYGHIKKTDILSIGPFNNIFYNIYVRNIRNIYDKDVNILNKNNFGCLAIKQLEKHFIFKKNHIRKGIYITNIPSCCKEFIAKIYILHHPTTIKTNYQSTIHCGTVVQSAKILEIINIKDKTKNSTDNHECLRSGDTARVKFLFLFRPEYIENNSMFIFRENNSKGIGKIQKILTI